MVPLYVDILQLLACSDVRKIRLFYLEHGLSIHSARAWIQSRHDCTVITLDEPLQTSSDIEVKNSDAIINTATVSAEELLTCREQRLQHDNSSKNALLEPDFIDRILSDISSEDTGTSQHHHFTIKLSTASPPLQLYLYLVYCDRSNAVKVSASDQSYDVSVEKFKKIYGHLTSFHYISIKNGEYYHQRVVNLTSYDVLIEYNLIIIYYPICYAYCCDRYAQLWDGGEVVGEGVQLLLPGHTTVHRKGVLLAHRCRRKGHGAAVCRYPPVVGLL